jgi:hypothetical protein
MTVVTTAAGPADAEDADGTLADAAGAGWPEGELHARRAAPSAYGREARDIARGLLGPTRKVKAYGARLRY